MEPQEIEIIKQHTKALLAATEALLLVANKPEVPQDKQLWSIKQCAAHIGVSVSSFYQRFAPDPSFPDPIKLLDSHPRYRASEIIEWVDKQAAKNSKKRS